MSLEPKKSFGKRVPSRRLSRIAGLGRMTSSIAGTIAVNGVQHLATGKRPKISDLIMTPKNIRKVTSQLSDMRGAAMKIGQMISMDSGDFLPKELADILSTLRSDARRMPRSQLEKVLSSAWGAGWASKFESFDYHPIAAASIGQVHKAVLPSGETLAIKVQYPGIQESIDSDVNNIASLLKLTGLIPKTLTIKPVIEEGRKQFHQEADYDREAAYLSKFAGLLADDDFEVPKHYPEYSTNKILAMSYISSVPIEVMIEASQEKRNRIIEILIELTLRELFVFGMMQTDPNFANYRYNKETDRLVLLDFGASCDISEHIATAYQNIMQAALSGRAEDSFDVACQIGLIPPEMPSKYKSRFLEIIEMAIEPLSRDETFNFGDNQLALQMREKAMTLVSQRELWHVPPSEMIFIQRKLGGIYMLATRLSANVNVHAIIRKYCKNTI